MCTRPTSGAIAAAAILTAFALGFVPTFATAADDSIEVVPRWKVGDKLNYTFTKSRQKTNNGVVGPKSGARTPIEIEVAEATADGFVVRWTIGEATFDDPKQAENPIVRRMGNLVAGFTLVLELDQEATVTGMRNWDELKALSGKILDTLTTELQTAGLDQATITALQTQVSTMFSTKEQIEQFCVRETRLFFLPIGRRYTPGQPEEYEEHLPNPLGGEPFPSIGRFAFKSVDQEPQRVTVTWTQSVVPEEAARIMDKTVRDLAARMGKAVPNADALKSMTIKDDAEFVVDLRTGWPEQIAHKRSVQSGTSAQEDAITFERKRK